MGSGSDAASLLAGLPVDGLFPVASYHGSWGGGFSSFLKCAVFKSVLWFGFSTLVILLVPIVFSEAAAHIFSLQHSLAFVLRFS
jgi:hypothetical protein